MSKKNRKKNEQKRQHLYALSSDQIKWLVDMKNKEFEKAKVPGFVMMPAEF